jgi:hypothetical protein
VPAHDRRAQPPQSKVRVERRARAHFEIGDASVGRLRFASLLLIAGDG